MDFELQWLLLGLPVAFALGWLASRFDLRQWRREREDAPKAYFKGLNLLLNEQQDKAIDAFVEAVRQDPDTTDLHFALGNLFRRRGEYERAVRVHQHLLSRADLAKDDRDRAQHALAQDFMQAGLFDRAEQACRALIKTSFDSEARRALLTLEERSRDWRAAIESGRQLEGSGVGSYATRIAHYWCELALEADARQQTEAADEAVAEARQAAPLAARPLVLEGERAEHRNEPALALQAWSALSSVQPAAFHLIAANFAACALACGQTASARGRLESLYEREPTLDLLDALALLDVSPEASRRRLASHLERRPSLSAARMLLYRRAAMTELPDAELAAVAATLADAAKPFQRYRCAACGFDAQHYFWQCPGCLTWDSYPPRRLEDQ